MKNFTYYRPATPAQAVGLLDKTWGTAELLAGGTDLLDRQKEYVAGPDKVISLGGLKDFGAISSVSPPGAFPPVITIGAGAKLAEIAAHKDVRRVYPALSTAAGEIAGPQIRNMGTLGGSLCQRNRCWYFRDEHTVCLLKGGDKCYALDGENRYHAIFTKGHACVIAAPSTLGTVLIALGAMAKVLGPKGERTVPMAKFFRAPTKADEREHVLAPDEILLSVSVSGGAEQFYEVKNASYEVRQKLSSDWPLVQAAVGVPVKDGKVKGARIVLGQVAPTPHLAEAAGKALEGKALSEETINAAAELAAEGAKPLAQNGYKVRLTVVAVKRALLSAAGAKKYWEAQP
jgi:xanthine dehydrogenase YagS FAD-binding subunit